MTGTALEIIQWLWGEVQRLGAESKDKRYEIKVYREKRSLYSNAYFHTLCDKLRQKLGISMARCKNHLIADYGQIEYLSDGEAWVYKTNAPEDRMMELETVHTKCVKIVEEDGKKAYFYRVYRGSHTYDSAEMTQLIKGTIEECKAQGIQTATPAELAHMAALWEQRHDKRQEAQKNETVGDNTRGQENR